MAGLSLEQIDRAMCKLRDDYPSLATPENITRYVTLHSRLGFEKDKKLRERELLKDG